MSSSDQPWEEPWTAVYAPMANERGLADGPHAAPAGKQRHRKHDDAVDGREADVVGPRRADQPTLDHEDDEDRQGGAGDEAGPSAR